MNWNHAFKVGYFSLYSLSRLTRNVEVEPTVHYVVTRKFDFCFRFTIISLVIPSSYGSARLISRMESCVTPSSLAILVSHIFRLVRSVRTAAPSFHHTNLRLAGPFALQARVNRRPSMTGESSWVKSLTECSADQKKKDQIALIIEMKTSFIFRVLLNPRNLLFIIKFLIWNFPGLTEINWCKKYKIIANVCCPIFVVPVADPGFPRRGGSANPWVWGKNLLFFKTLLPTTV